VTVLNTLEGDIPVGGEFLGGCYPHQVEAVAPGVPLY
jgi:hypothetical protein